MASMPGMIIKIGADTRAAVDALNQINGRMEGFGSVMKRAGIALAGAFSVNAIVDFAKDAVQAGSDLQESMSKVSVVFGDASDAVTRWSENSAAAFGQSQQQALEAAGTYGNLLKAFGATDAEAQKMSTSLVELAADLASFNNTSVEDALTALRSGLSGETEPLKRYGVALNDVRLKAVAMEKGLYSGKGTLDVYAKSVAAYELIMRDTALAQGDFARTSDGLANQQRILEASFTNMKAALGSGIIDGFGDLAGSGGDLATAMKDLEPVMRDIGLLIGEQAADWLFLAGQVANLAASLSDLVPTMGDASEEASALDRSLAGLSEVFSFTGTISFFAGALQALQNGPMRKTTDSMDGMGVAARNTGGLWKKLDKQIRDVGAAAPTTADRLIELGNDALASGRAALNAGKGWAGFYEAAMQAEADYRNNLVSGTVTSALSEGVLSGPDPDAIRRMRDFQAELARLKDGLKDIGGSSSSGGSSVSKLAADWDAYGAALSAASDATVEISGKQLEITEKQGNALEKRLNKVSAAIAFQQGVIDSSKAKLEEYDKYVQSIVSKVTGGLNPDDFVSETEDGQWIFDALGFEAAIKDKAKITEAVAGIAGQIPEAWAQSILGLPTDKANAIIGWFANNPATDATIVTEYNALTQKVTDVWGPQLAEAYTGINKEATVAGIEQAKQTIADEAAAFKTWVKKKLKTRVEVEVVYKEVGKPAAAESAVRSIQSYEALNGRSWRV